jgi:hypothetical protein
MAKKIVNPTSTLQINFDKESKKDRVPGEVSYRIRLIFGWFLFFIGTLLTLVSYPLYPQQPPTTRCGPGKRKNKDPP